MIVKNEAAIIERCLASVAPIVSYYVIADTGSTDGTQDVIRRFMKKRGIPGEIVQTTFRDFSSARNEALQLARKSRGAFDYILLTDADMDLIIDDPTAVRHLTSPAYTILQRNNLSFRNVRLIQRNVTARYIGVTHEYLEAGDRVVDLEGVWFEDRADGGNRFEKLERDIRLLTHALNSEPDNARYRFYLGQSYKDSRLWAPAIEQYQKRIELGGWPEEVWYSACMIAFCCQQAGDVGRFIEQTFLAYQVRPTRAEPLYLLAKHYRETGQYEACMLIAEAAVRIPFPADDRLFIQDEVYTSGFRTEIGIAGFYSALPDRVRLGRETCFGLGIDRSVDRSVRHLARLNSKYYARSAETLFGAFEYRDLGFVAPAGFAPTNPSILIEGNRRQVVVRTVNYEYVDSAFHYRDGAEFVQTRNFLVELDETYEIITSREIGDRSGVPVVETMVRGFEDCRLFAYRGELWLSATVRDRRDDLLNQIAIARLDETGDIVEMHVQTSYQPHSTQKNWMPFVTEDGLRFVYLCDPTQVLRVDPASMQATLVFQHVPRLALEHLRGGSQLLKVSGGWLAAVHEQAWPRDEPPAYLHRFILFGNDFKVRGATEPFWFVSPGVEFCAGLARDEERGKLVVSFGINDGAAMVGFLDETAVLTEIAHKSGYSYHP